MLWTVGKERQIDGVQQILPFLTYISLPSKWMKYFVSLSFYSLPTQLKQTKYCVWLDGGEGREVDFFSFQFE